MEKNKFGLQACLHPPSEFVENELMKWDSGEAVTWSRWQMKILIKTVVAGEGTEWSILCRQWVSTDVASMHACLFPGLLCLGNDFL